MNETQQLAQFIADIQAHGDVGPQALAQALIEQGVRLSAQPRTIDENRRHQRIEQMLTYAASILSRRGTPLGATYRDLPPATQEAYLQNLRTRLNQNPYFHLGMQTSGEMLRALGDTPELETAYARLTPEERAQWLAGLRDAWHDFDQAARALGAPEL